jgi:transketolase
LQTIADGRARELELAADDIRRLSLEMITWAQWGHIGGSFSQAEIMACLYFAALRVDPAAPRAPGRDRLVLSKAHGSPALYAALALRGFIARDAVYGYCRLDGLDGHTSTRTPGIDASGGSLGLGLGLAGGLALGLKLKELFAPRVFCILGDGEINEGQVWEAAMSAAHFGLDNLIAILDYNKVAAKDFTHRLMSVEPVVDKWRAFGWIVHEVDGHDVREITAALARARTMDVRGKPIVVVCHTVKGRGLEEAEFNYQWHTHAPHADKAAVFLEELNRRSGRDERFGRVRPDCEDGGLREVVESVPSDPVEGGGSARRGGSR